MVVLAIDPGTKHSAYVRYSTETGKVTGDYLDNPTLLIFMRNSFVAPDALVIEPIAMGGMIAGVETFETAEFVGMLFEAARTRFGHVPRYKLRRAAIFAHLVGQRIKGKSDAQIRQVLIDRFGGESKAIGGVKCKACKGRGATRKVPCVPCKGAGLETPRGPLYELATHQWSALAVAVTFAERADLAERVII